MQNLYSIYKLNRYTIKNIALWWKQKLKLTKEISLKKKNYEIDTKNKKSSKMLKYKKQFLNFQKKEKYFHWTYCIVWHSAIQNKIK